LEEAMIRTNRTIAVVFAVAAALGSGVFLFVGSVDACQVSQHAKPV